MILFRKNDDRAIIPKRHSECAAGFDLHSIHETKIGSRQRVVVDTGISMAIPPGFVGVIKPRSGAAVKNGIDVLAGVIDADYRGSIKVVLINHGYFEYEINEGDRIAQLIVYPVMLDSMEVQKLDETERSGNGFGSTGGN